MGPPGGRHGGGCQQPQARRGALGPPLAPAMASSPLGLASPPSLGLASPPLGAPPPLAPPPVLAPPLLVGRDPVQPVGGRPSRPLGCEPTASRQDKKAPLERGFAVIQEADLSRGGSGHSARQSRRGRRGRGAPQPRPAAVAPPPRRHWDGIRRRGRDGSRGRIRRRHRQWRQSPRQWLPPELLRTDTSCVLPAFAPPRGDGPFFMPRDSTR